MGARVDVQIPLSTSYPVTVNNAELAEEMLPVLLEVAGEDQVDLLKPITGAEDFSFFAREVPGFMISLGGKPPGKPLSEVAAHHTPDFYIDESGLDVGVEVMTAMAWTYLQNHSGE
jgi:amidohydrolase